MMMICVASEAFAAVSPQQTDLKDKYKVEVENVVYNGEYQAPTYKVVEVATGKELVEGKDYKATYTQHRVVTTDAGKAAGNNSLLIKGIGSFSGELKGTWAVTKAKQKNTVSPSATTVKNTKKNYITFKVTKAKDNTGKVTYTMSDKLTKAGATISQKTGKLTLKKGMKKGTYKVVIKVAASRNYKAYQKTIYFKVK